MTENMTENRSAWRPAVTIAGALLFSIALPTVSAAAAEDVAADLPSSSLAALLTYESTNDSDGESSDSEDGSAHSDELPAELLSTSAENADEEALVWLVVAEERGAAALEAAQAKHAEAYAQAMALYDEAMQRKDEALARRDAALEQRDERLAEAFERRDAALVTKDEALAGVSEQMGKPADVAGGPPADVAGGPSSGVAGGPSSGVTGGSPAGAAGGPPSGAAGGPPAGLGPSSGGR